MGKEDWHSASDDCDQLVHVSYCVFVPNARLFSGEGHCVHPDGLLCLRHYLEMRSRPCHLSDLLRQVQQGVSFAISMCMRCRVWLGFASFSSRTDIFNFDCCCRSLGSGCNRLRKHNTYMRRTTWWLDR